MKHKKKKVFKPAPILLFTYRRIASLKKLVQSLKNNKDFHLHELYIFSDGPKNNSEIKQVHGVRHYIKKIKGFKKISIYLRKKNIGLAENISQGVSKIIKQKKKVIVLEDDLVIFENFLEYMNNSLKKYKNNKKVWHISGWNYNFNFSQSKEDAFFSKYMNCWGWATWSDRWKFYEKNPNKILSTWTKSDIKSFNLDNSHNFWSQIIRNKNQLINTWAVFWYATIFKKNGLSLNPIKPLVYNCGFDNFSTHTFSKNPYIKELKKFNENFSVKNFPEKVCENKNIYNQIKAKIKPNIFKFFLYKLLQ